MPDTDKSADLLEVSSAQEWERWLSRNHDTSTGIWLVIAKKSSGRATPTYQEALDVALCWGWIDARKRSFDDSTWWQRFTPRSPRGTWSKVNTEHVARLTAAGRMQPPGLRQVELAKADGRWEAAYAPQSAAGVPDDLAAALARSPAAAEFFATLDSRNRYSVLYRIETAKKPQTRARRIETFVAMLAAGEKIYP